MSALERREVKFGEILADLLGQSGLVKGRKKLAAATGVSEATISHYIHSRVKPSFDVLVGTAEFFNVPLDFLVFGEQSPPAAGVDPAGVRAQVRRALAESNDNAGRQRDAVARISRILQAQVEEAAETLILDPSNLGPVGFVTDSEAISLEYRTSEMWVMTRVFQSDIQLRSDGPSMPGSFFEVMTDNLKAQRPYRYLLYGKWRQLQPSVAIFRELAGDAGVSQDVMARFLQFRVIDSELPSAICVHRLDLDLLQRTEPILWERFRSNVTDDGLWGYISVERPDAQGGVALEPIYLQSTLRMFKRDWEAGKPM